MSQEQGGHLHQGAEAQWEEGVRTEEGGKLEGTWRVDVEKDETRGGRGGWRIEGRALVATMIRQSHGMDQDMLETGDSQKGTEERHQRPRQATALQEVMVRGILLEVTEERCLRKGMGGKPHQELMGEDQPQELTESKGVRGVHQKQGLLHLPRRLLLRHTESSRQERKLQELQERQQKGDSCSKHFFVHAKHPDLFLAGNSLDIISLVM